MATEYVRDPSLSYEINVCAMTQDGENNWGYTDNFQPGDMWSVYVREYTGVDGESVNLLEDEDFASRTQADLRARELAHKYQAAIEYY